MQWCKKDPTGGWHRIETKSSRPHSHAHALKAEVVDAIVEQRRKHNRCAEVVHQELKNQGVGVSLSSGSFTGSTGVETDSDCSGVMRCLPTAAAAAAAAGRKPGPA